MTTTKPRKLTKKGTVLPPTTTTDMEALLDLSKFLEQHDHPAALIGPDGEQLPLPMEVYEVLKRVVAAMSRQRGVTIAPVEQQLTTQQAADLLGISRPTLVKLIKEGKLQSEQPSGSRHRRLRLAEVLEYQRQQRRDRDEALTQLVRDAEEDGLYDADPEALRDAIKKARKERAERRASAQCPYSA